MLAAIRNRLTERLPDITVLGAVELAAAEQDHQRDTIYVVPLEDRPAPNDLENGVRQQVDIDVGLVYALTNRRDRRGEAATDELDALRDRAREAVLGFAPAPEADPLEYRRGVLRQMAEQTVWWQDTYQTGRLISAI